MGFSASFPPAAALLGYTYTYDAVGNRLTKNTDDYTYDAADELTDLEGVTFGYEENGNQIERGDDAFDLSRSTPRCPACGWPVCWTG